MKIRIANGAPSQMIKEDVKVTGKEILGDNSTTTLPADADHIGDFVVIEVADENEANAIAEGMCAIWRELTQ